MNKDVLVTVLVIVLSFGLGFYVSNQIDHTITTLQKNDEMLSEQNKQVILAIQQLSKRSAGTVKQG